MGVAGQPNVDAILVRKAASCALSHRHQVPHCVQSRRCACGPLLEPMVATWLPQRQARGSVTRRPMIGELEDGADEGGDEEPKKSSCCSMCAALIDGTSPVRRRGYAQTKTPQWTARTALTRTCPRPFRYAASPKSGISSLKGGSSFSGRCGFATVFGFGAGLRIRMQSVSLPAMVVWVG
jgi:hypothetical protein